MIMRINNDDDEDDDDDDDDKQKKPGGSGMLLQRAGTHRATWLQVPAKARYQFIYLCIYLFTNFVYLYSKLQIQDLAKVNFSLNQHRLCSNHFSRFLAIFLKIKGSKLLKIVCCKLLSIQINSFDYPQFVNIVRRPNILPTPYKILGQVYCAIKDVGCTSLLKLCFDKRCETPSGKI